MSTATERQAGLLELAALELVPILDGCARALTADPQGGGEGKAANLFGPRIVEAWSAWFRSRPPEVRQQALADLAAPSPEDARREAAAAVERAAPQANPDDRSVAAAYLSLLPGRRRPGPAAAPRRRPPQSAAYRVRRRPPPVDPVAPAEPPALRGRQKAG
jgi:hypothetical protein